jgi:hypothetical protein
MYRDTPSAGGATSAADFFRKIELLEGQGEEEVANDGQEKEKMKGERRHNMVQRSRDYRGDSRLDAS